MSFLTALGKQVLTRAQSTQTSCGVRGTSPSQILFVFSVITTLNQTFFFHGGLFSSQNPSSVGHWNGECSVNRTIATEIRIPDVGNQRLSQVLFALLTDTFLLNSERLMGLQEVTHNLRGVYCPQSVTASHPMHSGNCRDVLGHMFPALSNLHKLNHKSNYS